jgi:hypothetical protein
VEEAISIKSEILKGRDHLENPDVDARILNLILQK